MNITAGISMIGTDLSF